MPLAGASGAQATQTPARAVIDGVRDASRPYEKGANCKAEPGAQRDDIYCWLTYRMSYLERPSEPIPWAALKRQFGCDFGRTRAFKEPTNA